MLVTRKRHNALKRDYAELVALHRALQSEVAELETERDDLEDESQQLYVMNYELGDAAMQLSGIIELYKRYGLPVSLFLGVLIGYLLR